LDSTTSSGFFIASDFPTVRPNALAAVFQTG
jgi:hypothetical protein